MQSWHEHQYDPVWYETEYVSPSEVKILVESALLKRLKNKPQLGDKADQAKLETTTSST